MIDPLTLAGLLCFWTFQEEAGEPRIAQGPHAYQLIEQAGPMERLDEGVFGPHSMRVEQGQWLRIKRADCPALDLHGPEAQVSVVAWVRRAAARGNSCQAVAGMWNEHALRQYCLFLNLQIWKSSQQVCAHISAIGGATPGYKYCMDAAIGATPVPLDKWQTVGMSYDGTWAKAWLNGRLDERGDRNPYHYPGGLFEAGPGGADFTVGAVTRPNRVDENFQDHGSTVANNFVGDLGGLAVFDRALTADEMAGLAAWVRPVPAE